MALAFVVFPFSPPSALAKSSLNFDFLFHSGLSHTLDRILQAYSFGSAGPLEFLSDRGSVPVD
ncbi:hypothetical protein N7450_010891 [Penicillium hetheringtonii]|uniref:Uncharacterized protein n=1 Tax=Penicillium hetheringtonii TaxID=911720 RepID=A0AAD6D8Y6_9EURO|nr:hypothetical protein N7450_010891 [Penicillium hetheringtonii]